MYLTQCAQLISKQIEVNFKHLFGKELAIDVVSLVLLTVVNDLFILCICYRCGL